MNTQLQKFVESNIHALECVRPVQNENAKLLNTCHCGREFKDHKETKVESGKKWNVKENTISNPSDAYGEMRLSGFRVLAGVRLKYIRASQSDKLCQHLYTVMTKYWEFNKPELIISINGGAKKMIPLNSEQKSAFKRGLINVSKAASTWIITGGFNFGVSKLVGEAAKDYNIASQDKSFIVLGIGTWGAVFNRQDLVLKNDGHTPTYHNAEGQFTLKGQAPLDPNHDAFILYDCGLHGAFGKEIQFRTEFEMFISQQAKCSVVQVIVEGGKKCIETADKALKQGIPVVVMKGSKRAADLICDVIEAEDQESMTQIIDTGLSDYKEEWSIATDTEMEGLKKHLESLHSFKQKKLIHIFSMSDFTKNLDRAILEAAFSGKINGEELKFEERLKLAMTFNRTDVAEECVMQSRDEFTDYGEFIEIALIKNQWKFVNMFLSRGTKVEYFLTKRLLVELYFGKEANKYINANTLNIIGYLKNSVRPTKQNRLSTIGLIIKKLTRNLIHSFYHESKHSKNCCSSTIEEIDEETEVIVNKDFEKCCYDDIMHTSFPPRNKGGQLIYTEQDLFIWALLTQRWEMAKIFWENGKDHIGSALIAWVICNSMSKIANKEGEMDMAQTLLNNCQDFENLAINILTSAYRRDKTRTHLLLIRALPYWGRVTCMEIANKCEIINFLSHSACQTRLNSIWLGVMSMYTSTILFLLNLPFAFITSKWLIFSSSRTEDYEPQVSFDLSKENSLESNVDDIKYSADNHIRKNDDSIVKPKTEKETEYLEIFRRKQQLAWKYVSFCEAVRYYYRAPITKFTMHIISYLLFLTIFSYMCLVELMPLSSVKVMSDRQMEYAVYTYILSFILEEIRQSVADSQYDTFKGRLDDWISSLWNIFDLFLYLIFATAFILRHIPTIDFVYARTTFSTALSMFFLRFLQFYYAHRSIGPKVISVSKMIKDIVFFLALYVIAIFAYGTFAQALLYSNTAIGGFVLKSIVYMPYWQSYGDLHIDYVEGNTVLNGVTPTPNAIVIVAFALFMLFTNALLMNMLVAMFGMTFQKVEENANRIWAYNRYKLIEEFYFRPILPPPLNVFEIFYMLFQWMSRKCNHTGKFKINDLAVNLTHDEDLRSAGFEQQCLEVYLIDNPLLTSYNDADTNIAITTDKDIVSVNVPDSNKNDQIENLRLAFMEAINEVRSDVKSVSAQVHKMRRHQKRDSGMSRMNTEIREPIKRQNVLPIDNEDRN